MMRCMFRLIMCAVYLALMSCASGGGGEPDTSSEGGSGIECDTTPVTLDLRTPFVMQTLAAVPTDWPQGEVFAIPYTYLLHVPDHLPNGPVPLMVAMHGLGGSGPQFANQSEWARYADDNGFIVVFPTGPRKWDTRPGSFDVSFIRNVVAQVRSERCIDPRRIWATGHSYGGYMSQRLACEAGDLFAAGADSSGGDVTQPLIGGDCNGGESNPPPSYEPMPLGFWHGTADQFVDYGLSRDTLAKWVEKYQCSLLEEQPDALYGPVEVYGNCGRADIVAREAATGHPFRLRFHTYANQRHGYPDGCGGQGQLSATPCEPDPETWPTVDFHNGEILDFLRANPRAGPAVDQP